MNKAAQQLGKLGGAARKAQKPDYSAMGKAGMAKRWGVRKDSKNSTEQVSEKAKTKANLTEKRGEPDAQIG